MSSNGIVAPRGDGQPRAGAAVSSSTATGSVATAAPAAQETWFKQAFDTAIEITKGDYNGPGAILLDTALGMVPGVGQIIDARDLLLALRDFSDNPTSFDAAFQLITACMGVVPGGGDAIKRSLRGVKSGAIPIQSLLNTLRPLGKGNTEKLILDFLEPAKIKPHLQALTATLKNSRFLDALDSQTRNKLLKTAQQLETQLLKHYTELNTRVKGWLKKQPNTSADPDYVSKKTPKKAEKPDKTNKDTASQSKEHHSKAHVNRQNIFYESIAELNQHKLFFMGILGEHMADYWVTEEQHWAAGWHSHDWGQDGKWSNPDKAAPKKLNDKGSMTPLWPMVPRGRGIDGLWRTNGGNGRPYAVIEAKAYATPTKTLGEMLDDVFDKQEHEDWKDKKREWDGKGRRSKGKGGKRGKAAPAKTPQPSPKEQGHPEPQKPEKTTMQMSHLWIKQRIIKATKDLKAQRDLLGQQIDGSKKYTRHVVFFSVPDIFEHAIAILKHVKGEAVQDTEHAKHSATRTFNDQDLDREEQRRVASRANKKGGKKP